MVSPKSEPPHVKRSVYGVRMQLMVQQDFFSRPQIRKGFFRQGFLHYAAKTPLGLKATVSRDFSCPVFFIKQLLLVPIGMPKTDFEFFRIFAELFVFVIDSTGESIRIL